MSNSSIPVIKFLFKNDLRVLNEALNITPGYDVEEFNESSELATYLSNIPAGLVIASLSDKQDLIQIATFMKIGKKMAKDTAVKMVVVNLSGDRSFEKAIGKLGILDIMDNSINTKAFKFKIDFWMKSLSVQVKNSVSLSDQKVKSLDANKSTDKKSSDMPGLAWSEALELEDDIWILKQDSDCKKILSKWLVRLMGPSPYVGNWVEVDNKLWRFDIKEHEKDMYVPNEGAWFFSGDQKPDFVWKENVWLLTGDDFNLYFKSGEKSVSRIKCKNKELSIAKNSLYAKTKEPVIIESFDKDLVFKKESEFLQNMEGKNETDHLDGGPLSGKTKTASERKGNLTGKLEGTDEIEHQNLEQKSSTSKEKNFWGNKNTYEEEESGSGHSVEANRYQDGKNLVQKNDHKEHQKYYKNHNEAEHYEGQEPNLSGKSSTDQIEGHYDNSRKLGERDERKERDLSGKSSTDQINGHYDNRRKPNERDERKEREERGESPSQKTQDLSGKSSTDEISSHYDSGKSSTDKSEGFYRNPEREEKTSQASSETSTNEFGSGEKKQHGFKNNELEKLNSHYRKGKEKEEKLKKPVADVLPFKKSPEEETLDYLTQSAKVVSFIIQEGAKIECGLDDFFDETIVFKTDNKNISEKSIISLDMNFKFMDRETKLKMDGNVTSVDKDDEGARYITVQISKENASAFNAFMKLYEVRQSNITEFLKKAKGL